MCHEECLAEKPNPKNDEKKMPMYISTFQMTGSTLPSPHILGKHINFGKNMPNTDNNKAPSISSGGNYQSKQLKKQEWKVDGGGFSGRIGVDLKSPIPKSSSAL